MIFPFGVEFHAEQRLFVWRPRGAVNEKEVSDVVAALGQLEAQFRAPFNRFMDSADGRMLPMRSRAPTGFWSF